MRRIKQFASRRSVLLTRAAAIILMLVFSTVLLSQAAFAQNTYVITDGDRVLVYTTYATDPGTVLDEAGLKLGKDDTYTTQEAGGGTEIIINRMQMVTVNDGSQTLKIGTYGETVEALLNRLGITWNENTRITQPLDADTCDGMVIEIFHQAEEIISYTKTVDFETTYCYDASLAPGEIKVLVEGQPGQIRCEAKVTYENGKEVVREILSEDLITPPVDSVVACSIDRGNKLQEGSGRQFTMLEPLPVITAATENQSSTEASSNAEAEDGVPLDGGTITTASGEILTYTKSISMTATAYSCEGYTGITATGTTARVGAVAVDPSVIPLGTRLYIITEDGMYNYGVCVAEDTGGLIQGNRVDLYFDTENECDVFGVRNCTVYVLG